MSLNFFSICSKVYKDTKIALEYGENFLLFRINIFELVAVNSPLSGENTWNPQTMG